MRIAGPLILALAVLPGAPALAAPPVPAQPPTTVAPVTVFPNAPKLVSTWPAAGQAVSPGVLILTLKFDQPMQARGFDIAPAAGAAAPNCLKTPRLLNDGRTFVLLCTVAPQQTYGLAFNGGPADAKGGFANIGDQRAAPATLSFTTNGGDGPRDIRAAMKAQGLTDLDSPIQDSPPMAPEKPLP